MYIQEINKKEYDKLRELSVNYNEETYWDEETCTELMEDVSEILCNDNYYGDDEVAKILQNATELEMFFYNEFKVTKISKDSGFHIPSQFIDHACWIKFDKTIFKAFQFVQGLISFPYSSFEIIQKYYDEIGDNWDVYIINPKLLGYNHTIGLFFTPNLYMDYEEGGQPHNLNIEEINSYFEIRTGYPLFYKFSMEEVKPLTVNEFDNSIEAYYKSIMEDDYTSEGVKPLFQFWYDNRGTVSNYFDALYDIFDKVGRIIYETIDIGNRTKSNKPFQLYIGDKLVLDDLRSIEFDINAFGDIYYNNSTYHVSDLEKEQLLAGEYKLCLK